jgi:hypothetical protein
MFTLGSIAIGLAVGLISAAFFKHAKHLKDHPHYEVCVNSVKGARGIILLIVLL